MSHSQDDVTASTRAMGNKAAPIQPGKVNEATLAGNHAAIATELFLAVFVFIGLVAILSWTCCRSRGHQVVDIDEVATQVVPYCVQFRKATWQDLAQIPGIGETLAKRIIDARGRGLKLDSLDDLAAVHGIGPQKLAMLGNYLQFPETAVPMADSHPKVNGE